MNLSQKNKIPNLIFVDELGMFPELRKLWLKSKQNPKIFIPYSSYSRIGQKWVENRNKKLEQLKKLKVKTKVFCSGNWLGQISIEEREKLQVISERNNNHDN
ncbi:MAG: hypothetical protein LBR43_01070 [Spiroplasmataceae bacterium]|jgi:hypothetical protein|nr:hypothetical protein [Spiroplasmataceae bacterium]